MSTNIDTGDVSFRGNISAGNLGMFRNRFINGDMRVDQRNAGTGSGGLTGSYLTYKTQPSSFYTVDRWAIASPNVGALTAKQVALADTDRAATGGAFSHAVEVGLVPRDGLAIYLPMDGTVTDASGNGVATTVTGTMQYVTACVTGTQALYLANEANVVATQTRAANRLQMSYTQLTNGTTSISYWFCCTKLPTTAGNQGVICSFTALTNSHISVYTQYSTATAATLAMYNSSTSSTTTTIAANTWYHVVELIVPGGTCSFYVNGTLIGTIASTPVTGYVGTVSVALGDTAYTSGVAPFAGFIDDFRMYNRALSATEIATLATSVPFPAAPDSTGLSTRLTFDNTTVDAQATLPAPTVTGSVVYTPVSKVGTAALDLTGNTAGVTATNALTYTLATGQFSLPLTVSVWINATSATASGVFQNVWCIGNNTGTNSTSYQIYFDNAASGKLYFNASINSVAYYMLAATALTSGTWYHIVTTVNNSYSLFYVNGVLTNALPTGSGSLNVVGGSGNPTQIRLGAQTGTALGNAFKGLLDDVRIYNRVLTTAEVAGLYAQSQYASYSLFQQTIEANNLSDLGWGTASAQPITASMWIKNNTSSAQQFSLSANNAGLLALIDFEGSSYADKMGYFTNATLVGSGAITTSTYKIGNAALDLTANTAGGVPTTYVTYNLNNIFTYPHTISCWFNITTLATSNIPLTIGNLATNNTPIQFVINASGIITVYSNNFSTSRGGPASISIATSSGISINTWYHICATVQPGGNFILYLNGVLITSTAVPIDAIPSGKTTPATLCYGLRLGTGSCASIPASSDAFKGYIDDVRIYNRALSATQVAQLYANNANSTATSTYLLPRSIVATSPAIPANSWQRVSVTFPGDTTGNWLSPTGANNDAGLTLSLALAASPLYATSSTTWNSTPEYAGTGIQTYGASSTSFLANIANTVYVTGVQLEKGSIMTPFEFRPLPLELQLCQRYLLKHTLADNSNSNQIGPNGWADSATTAVFPIIFRQPLRAPPILLTTGTASDYRIRGAFGNLAATGVPFINNITEDACAMNITTSGMTAGYGCFIRGNVANAFVAFFAEL